jgi:flagellar biogenesis protein FliO
MTQLIFILAFAVYAVLTLPRVMKQTKSDFKHFNNLN